MAQAFDIPHGKPDNVQATPQVLRIGAT